MCHGDIDPRFLARDIEARMAPVTAPVETEELKTTPSNPGLVARALAWFAAVRMTKATHG